MSAQTIRCARRAVAIRGGALAAYSRAALRCPTSTSTPTNAPLSLGMAGHDRVNSNFEIAAAQSWQSGVCTNHTTAPVAPKGVTAL